MAVLADKVSDLASGAKAGAKAAAKWATKGVKTLAKRSWKSLKRLFKKPKKRASVDDVLKGAERTNPGKLRKGRAAQFDRAGGRKQADADFDALRPTNVVNKGKGVRVGELSDGRKVIVRPSTKGPPTLEVQGDAHPIKIRYSD